MTPKPSIAIPEREAADIAISAITSSDASTNCHAVVDFPAQKVESADLNGEVGGWIESSSENLKSGCISTPSHCFIDYEAVNLPFDADNKDLTSYLGLEVDSLKQNINVNESTVLPFDPINDTLTELRKPEERQSVELFELTKPENIDENESSSEYFSATDSHQSILVSFSSRCVLKGTLCERSRLLRIKFYGCFDKPLGRYLRDDLFDQVKSFWISLCCFFDS